MATAPKPRAWLDYGFRHVNLYNISLVTFSFNARAIAECKKAGFREMGRRRGVLLIDGRRYDDIYMDVPASLLPRRKRGGTAFDIITGAVSRRIYAP